MSTDHRPSVDQLLTDTSIKYRPTIDQLSAKCRRSVGEVSVNEKLFRPRHIWNVYRPCLDRVSTDYRPTIDRCIDRVSTECWPSIDRLSTECRPTIDRVSTAISTAIPTDISVDITHSKQDPILLRIYEWVKNSQLINCEVSLCVYSESFICEFLFVSVQIHVLKCKICIYQITGIRAVVAAS